MPYGWQHIARVLLPPSCIIQVQYSATYTGQYVVYFLYNMSTRREFDIYMQEDKPQNRQPGEPGLCASLILSDHQCGAAHYLQDM